VPEFASSRTCALLSFGQCRAAWRGSRPFRSSPRFGSDNKFRSAYKKRTSGRWRTRVVGLRGAEQSRRDDEREIEYLARKARLVEVRQSKAKVKDVCRERQKGN